MSNKNYFENISEKVAFIVKYFRFFRLLIIIAYLIYLATLVVDVFSAVDYVPGVDEVKGRFSPIMAKNEVINAIETYFSDKENSLAKNLQNEAVNDPFSPYKIDNLSSVNNVSVPGNNIIN